MRVSWTLTSPTPTLATPSPASHKCDWAAPHLRHLPPVSFLMSWTSLTPGWNLWALMRVPLLRCFLQSSTIGAPVALSGHLASVFSSSQLEHSFAWALPLPRPLCFWPSVPACIIYKPLTHQSLSQDLLSRNPGLRHKTTSG